MKQKRKAKSLIPMHFNWNYWLLTNIILIIWGMLCFFALSLQTISVDALWMNGLYFSWYDDNTEVIYHMYYVGTEDQSEAWVISEMYMNQSWNDSNFYIVPSRVLIQPSLEGGTHTLPNLVGYDNYVNILWWNDIKLYSDNMSVIAWEYNIANEWNNNSVLLWWHGNVIWNGNWSGLPVVVLWWVGNSVGNNQNWNIVIWWSDNEIGDWVSNSNIIWGEYNKVSGNWNIVGGTNVDVGNSIGNVFVFSDSDSTFSPKSSNAFYLKTDNGVWLNEDPLVHDDWDNNGVSSSGSVSLWNIDINSVVCKPTTDGNLWVEWSWKGCLVWCTSASANDWQKRDLLDQSKRCKELCLNEGKCKDPSTWDNQNSSWHCSRGLDLDREKYCPGLDPTKWTNVVFDVILVDNGECWGNGNVNQCVYQCKDHYTLTWGKCMGSCQKTWDDDSWVAHWDVVWAFTDDSTQCSNECRDHEVMLKCLDGSWSISTNNLYNGCTTYGRVCSSSYYTFNSPYLLNGKCSESCTNYSVNANICVEENTIYKCTCDDGFVFNEWGTACVSASLPDPDDSLCWYATLYEFVTKPTAGLCSWDAVVVSGPEPTAHWWEWTCQLGDADGRAEICMAGKPVEPDDYKCYWVEPAHAVFVAWTDEDLTEDTPYGLYSSVTAAAWHKCSYVCDIDNWYEYDTSTRTCKSKYSCIWEEPKNAEPVPWSTSNLTEDTNIELYETVNEAAWHKCAYVCKDGFNLIGWSCVKCVEWTLSWTPGHYSCVIQTECGEWQIWQLSADGKRWECLRIGNCRVSTSYNSVISNSLPRNYVVQSWNDVRPLWTDYELTCVDDSSSVIPNTCQFSCIEGYYCWRDYRDYPVCDQPYCFGWDKDEKYATDTYENPTMWTRQYEDRFYVYWKIVTTQEELDELRNSNAEWCYMYCDEDHYYNGVCMSAEEKHEKENWWGNNPPENKCSWRYYLNWAGYITIWRPWKQYDPYVYVWLSRFNEILNDESITGCYFTCNGDLWYWYDSAYELCEKMNQCGPWQYLNSLWSCQNCSEWYEPDPDSINDFGNATKCRLIDCWENWWWSTTEHACVSNASAWSCPDDSWTYDEGRNQCIKCLDDNQVWDFIVWMCIDN